MKKMPTLFLKLSVGAIGVAVIAFCTVAIPWIVIATYDDTEFAKVIYPILASIFLVSIPVLVALYQTLRLINYIDLNIAFSGRSVLALKKIKLSALAACAILTINLFFMYLWAERADAPGLIIIGLAFVFASFVVAIFAAVLQMLLQEAIDIKAENDLTV